MTSQTIRTLDRLDRSLTVAQAERAAEIRATRIAKADPFAHVVQVDACGAPVLDPNAPDLGCENR